MGKFGQLICVKCYEIKKQFPVIGKMNKNFNTVCRELNKKECIHKK